MSDISKTANGSGSTALSLQLVKLRQGAPCAWCTFCRSNSSSVSLSCYCKAMKATQPATVTGGTTGVALYRITPS